jgi:hypothetical protein
MRNWLTIISVVLLCSGPSSAALFPPYFVGAIVSLGFNQVTKDQGKESPPKWTTVGTGFFYGYLVQDDPEIEKRKYAVFLVTAGHVIKAFAEAGLNKITVRLDATEASAKSESFDIPITDWFFHPKIDLDAAPPKMDLAAAPTPIEFLRAKGLQDHFFASDLHALTKPQMLDAGVSAGDGVFILGFPMNKTGERRNYVILRQGAIARIAEFLDGASNTFLVDGFVFPGNSGGPVVSKPEIMSIQGTKTNSKAFLLGVVDSYEPYVDTAVSQLTRHPRISFEENSGLTTVMPVDFINEMLKARAEQIWAVEKQRIAPAPSAMPPSLPSQAQPSK